MQINSSKVVDENGEPMVVYHGSTRKFTAFNKKYIGSNGTSIGQGFYFTNDKQFADGYSSDGGNVFEVFLNLRKELNLDKVTIKKGQLKKILKEIDDIQSDEIDNCFLSNYDDVKYNGIERTLNNAVGLEMGSANSDVHLIGGIVNVSGNLNDVYMVLEKITGHDGIIGKQADGSVHFVVGMPNQIKSATDNAGPFSKENDDIRFRKSETAAEVNQRFNEELTQQIGGKLPKGHIYQLGLLEYVDKKRMSERLSKQRYNSADVRQPFRHATNIIESFVNPTLEHGKIIAEVENLSETLHTPIRIVKDLKEISDSDKQLEKRKRGLI